MLKTNYVWEFIQMGLDSRDRTAITDIFLMLQKYEISLIIPYNPDNV